MAASKIIGPPLDDFSKACDNFKSFFLAGREEYNFRHNKERRVQPLQCFHGFFTCSSGKVNKVEPILSLLREYIADLLEIVKQAGRHGLSAYHCNNCVQAGLDLDTTQARAERRDLVSKDTKF